MRQVQSSWSVDPHLRNILLNKKKSFISANFSHKVVVKSKRFFFKCYCHFLSWNGSASYIPPLLLSENPVLASTLSPVASSRREETNGSTGCSRSRSQLLLWGMRDKVEIYIVFIYSASVKRRNFIVLNLFGE